MRLNTRLRSTNSTGFKGVSVSRNRDGFEARVQKQRSRDSRFTSRSCVALWRATFPTAEEAARGYDEAVRAMGLADGAVFNFPRVGERGLDGEVRTA